MDKKFHLTLYQACNYLYMLGLKLNHVSKGGYWSAKMYQIIDSQWNYEGNICNFAVVSVHIDGQAHIDG